jgi:hypothetical protein
LRLHHGTFLKVLLKVAVGGVEELHPRRIASQVVNLIRQDQFIVIDGAAVSDEGKGACITSSRVKAARGAAA